MKNQKGFNELFGQLKNDIEVLMGKHDPSYQLEHFKQDLIVFFGENINNQAYRYLDVEKFTKCKELPEGMSNGEVFLEIILTTKRDILLEKMIVRLMNQMSWSSFDSILDEPSIEETTGSPFDTSEIDKSELSYL